MLRPILAIALAFALGGAARADTLPVAPLGDDGLHKEEWFALTFKDLAEDIETARDSGKRLVLVFEQRGCIYCKKVHEDLLTDAEIRSFIEENFMVVQYNMFGAEEVTDLDGETLTEKSAARKWGLVFTPTFLFMPEEVPEGEVSARDAAVATMPGAFGKHTFLNMFRWVHDKGYEGDELFQTYHARKLAEEGSVSNE
ncbi:thioredoxin [Acuticoccus sediminis]|uniref:Thioredoxin n=1 Tax=Acuticoccus sediminis TaxID=2184697 RepID=A0A8B2NSI9_9HYPH|nr:thioredoxin family protein [Acuticoccus sediminis]RAI00072.1 thioredoxin [Acuticoccus sediminis]